MNAHPLTSALLQSFVTLMAVPVGWIAAWRLFKELSR